jgi:L-iduronidase
VRSPLPSCDIWGRVLRVDPSDAGQLQLEWGVLDATLALLLRYGLRPGLEVMGSPSGLVGDARDPTQRRRLRHLLLRLTQRYAQRWGVAELREWRFETWNEPDVRKYFDRPLGAFLAYAHATAQALGEAGLGVGGPAGLLRPHHLRCWALVDDANRRRPPLLNFLSFHRKGNASADQVRLTPSTFCLEIDVALQL